MTGPNRREFLFGSLATILGASKEAGAEQETNLNTADKYLFDQEKIHFSNENKELPPEIDQLIQLIEDHQTKFLNNLTTINIEELEKDKQQLWQKFGSVFPDMPAYTQENYHKFLSRQLPKILSAYGIAAIPESYDYGFLDGTYVTSDTILSFLKIDKAYQQTFTHDHQTRTIDVVEITNPLHKDNSIVGDNKIGGAIFKNIFIFKKALDRAKRHMGEIALFLGQLGEETILAENSDAELLKKIKKTNDLHHIIDEKSLPFIVAFIKLLRQCQYDIKRITRDMEDDVKRHEAQHLADEEDEHFTKHFPYNPTNKIPDGAKQSINKSVHTEISAFLGEIQWSKDKISAFINITDSTLGRECSTNHREAVQWIIENLIKIISKNPDQYGIKIEEGIDVTREDQITMQLSNVIAREDLLDPLLQEVKKYHLANLDEDFSKKMMSNYSQHQEKLENWKKNGKIFGPAILIVGGAIWGLNKLAERKQRVNDTKNKK